MDNKLVVVVKCYSKYGDDVFVTNGFDSKTEQPKLDKWVHYPLDHMITFSIEVNLKQNTLLLQTVSDKAGILDYVRLNLTEATQLIQFSMKYPSLSCKYLTTVATGSRMRAVKRFQMVFRDQRDYTVTEKVLGCLKFKIKNAKFSKAAQTQKDRLNTSHDTAKELSDTQPNLYLPFLESQIMPTVPPAMVPYSVPEVVPQQKSFVPAPLNASDMMQKVRPVPIAPSSLSTQRQLAVPKFPIQERTMEAAPPINLAGNKLRLPINPLPQPHHNVSLELQKPQTAQSTVPGQHKMDKNVTAPVLSSAEIPIEKSSESGGKEPPPVTTEIQPRTEKSGEEGKIRISKKLIRSKLQDKKFQRWVC
ncbi:Rec114p KNAG_0E02160 [Huiozyma naganishii CBS 8797]|uniref:Uncharacterized protein n=1 Tax=Huiozyma naganishii (strain ATCC MYA-139 / BCRC 22969 / CBS 8797 / KCTC 17520 / NBRC 10181 / NCYC 3082 / Yp74L-3) TaxID=1071383 RepID=J7RZ67_HUIN7|nr:hypothetical protein KNAG_0E02160 [Kazachstania naganishii CBS 8797]CCK70477.1 hypothetical protein KNAG_0E02160 [Kazachstania naganishii CBS 8797]